MQEKKCQAHDPIVINSVELWHCDTEASHNELNASYIGYRCDITAGKVGLNAPLLQGFPTKLFKNTPKCFKLTWYVWKIFFRGGSVDIFHLLVE